MSMVPEGTTHPRGEESYELLLWIHSVIRDNLATIREVIGDIVGGASPERLRAHMNDLATNSVVWRLRVDCMRYCHLVHSHHGLEDASLFPFLCQVNPALRTVTDKLQADHIVVSSYLDDVEAAADRILTDESARAELAFALSDLADHLITHLDYEEENLAPTLRRLKDFPFG